MSIATGTRPPHRVSPESAVADPSARSYGVGVAGASGTSGTELVRLLEAHPSVRLRFATSRTYAGSTLDRVDPAAPPVELLHPDEAPWETADVVFLCLPHGSAGPAAARSVEAGARVIDLSGDHRLPDPETHARVYGGDRNQALADEAVYGLTELARGRVRGCRLVANPGCYATAANLALAPLAARGLVTAPPVIDGKSGISGAGRAAGPASHFCSVTEDVRPYKPGRAHRHVAEIERFLSAADPSPREHRVVFTPHLVPLDRGIQATITLTGVPGGADAVRAALAETYRGEPFVRVLPPDGEARIRGVARTNRADIAVFPVEDTDAVVVTSAIDNLLKGAAGQAVQNMNLMLDLPEDLALPGGRPDATAEGGR